MPAITATAPGKIILCGEHAVVYGQPAIAVPVSQVKARAIISAQPNQTRGRINIQAPDIGLMTNLEDLPINHPLAVAVKLVLGATEIDKPPALTLRVTSTIPIASGLGSGAAVSVATMRALSEFLGKPLADETVSALTFEVEKLYHGTPSGIDNSVITYEKPIYFVKDSAEARGKLQTIRVCMPFRFVIGDTGIASPTAAAVGDVRKSWQADRSLFQGYFESTGEIVDRARQVLEAGEPAALGELMDENQEILEKIGVSCPELEQLIHAARLAGAYGAKLSGGGRGGNMIALVSKETESQVASALKEAGATQILYSTVANLN
jgi:mevalonate kinase